MSQATSLTAHLNNMAIVGVQVIEVLETADYNGEERVRCAQGWFSARNANDRANIKLIKDKTP